MAITVSKAGGETLVDFAYARLRHDILAGKVAPGSKLRIEELRKSYNVSGSPLREALSRLVSEGLVEAEGQRGFRAPQTSLSDIRDITNTRKILDHTTLAAAIENGDVEWEAEFVAAFHRLTKAHEDIMASQGEPSEAVVNAWEERNREFHDAMVSACESKWLLRFREMVYAQAERYRRLLLTDKETAVEVQEEHRRMMEAALKRDIGALYDLADAHAERTYRQAVAMLATGER